MYTTIQAIHILVAISLVALVLLQNSQGGLGSAFGGGGAYRTRRGAERIIFRTTILFALLFLLTSVASLLIRP